MALLPLLVLLMTLAQLVCAQQPTQRPAHKPMPPIAGRPLQPPAPSGGQRERSPPQNQSTSEQHNAQPDRRGTIDSPLVVELYSPPKSNAETSEEATEKYGKAATDWWIIYLTAGLVAATILQFGALSYQAYWLRRTVRVAERSLTEVERPYVFVFNVHFMAGDVLNPPELYPMPSILYTVANYGKTPAIIENVESAARIQVFVPNDLMEENVGMSLVVSPIMQSGEVRSDLIKDTRASFDPARGVREIALKPDGAYAVPQFRNDENIFFRIVVRYRGAFTGRHESAFCWRYDTDDQAFIQHGGEEYNYLK